MKVLIVYFSATGNTAKVAGEYTQTFEALGHEVTTVSLPTAKPPAFSEYDLIGVGYPIHSFNAPANVVKFCKTFERRNAKRDGQKRVFVFKTSGEPVRMSDVSSLKIRKVLKKRGYTVTNEYQYVMPYNIIFRHSDADAYKMWKTAKALVPLDVNDIVSGERKLPKRMFMGGFLAWILRIEHPGARINGKFFKVNKNCVNCGMCVKTCPAKNIKIKNGKIKFGGKCLMCMRCAFNCPKNAVEIGFFKRWKVNGAYSFAEPEPDAPPQENKHADYCRKAYKRYYDNAASRIDKAETHNEHIEESQL